MTIVNYVTAPSLSTCNSGHLNMKGRNVVLKFSVIEINVTDQLFFQDLENRGSDYSN